MSWKDNTWGVRTPLDVANNEKEYQKYSKNFDDFTRELAKLSKKYGISLDVTGGVSYGKIRTIKYSSDLSSGDLSSTVSWE